MIKNPKTFLILFLTLKTFTTYSIDFKIIERIVNIKITNTTYTKPYFNYNKNKVVLINTFSLKKLKEEKKKIFNYNFFGLKNLSKKITQKFNSTFSYLNFPFLEKKKIFLKKFSKIKKYKKFLDLKFFKIKLKITENFFVENYESLFNTYFFLDKTKKKILFKKIKNFCHQILKLRLGTIKGCNFEFLDLIGKKKIFENVIINFQNSKKINYEKDFIKNFTNQYYKINQKIFFLVEILNKNLKKNNLKKIDKKKFLKKINLFFCFLSIKKFSVIKKYLKFLENFIKNRNHFFKKKKIKFSYLNFFFKLFTIVNLFIYGVYIFFRTIKQKKFFRVKKTIT